ncbi:DUF1428 family protein [Sorangium sp. So ce887]|uniref:DUF1428 family protein n=1 Tax=Sorangium sp. So ce887 TaxID=3133324 RepID=UPI003F5D6D84
MSYIDGFVAPVPTGKKAAYRELCVKAGQIFKRRRRKARRVSDAMLKRVKLDVAGLKTAHEARWAPAQGTPPSRSA